MNRVLLIILRGFGTGYTPGMPGTIGSLFALLLCLPIWFLRSDIGMVAVTAVLLALATFTASLTWIGFSTCRDEWDEFDPSDIVLDEFAGTFLVVGATAPGGSIAWIFLAFVLFRCFDMLKPFPIPLIEQSSRYAGLVGDDLMAATMAAIATVLLRVIVQSPIF